MTPKPGHLRNISNLRQAGHLPRSVCNTCLRLSRRSSQSKAGLPLHPPKPREVILLHVAGPTDDAHAEEVADVAFHVEGIRQGIGAQHALTDEGDFGGGVGDEEFGHAGFNAAGQVLGGEPSGVVEHMPTGFELGAGLNQGMADGLMTGDDFAKLHPLLGIGPGLFDGGLRDAEGHGGNFQLFNIECAASQHAPALAPFFRATDDVGNGNAGIIEIDIARQRIAQIDVLNRLQGYARRIFRDQHKGEILALLIAFGADQAIDVIGKVRARAPTLSPIDDNMVAVNDAACGDAGQVSAYIGFRQAIAEHEFAFSQGGQIGGLLRVIAIFGNIHPAIKGAMDEGSCQKRPCPAQFFDDSHSSVDVLAEATIFLFNRQATNAHGGELSKQVARPSVGAIPELALFAWGLGLHKAAQLMAQFGDVVGFWGKGVRQFYSPVRFILRFSLKAATASARSLAMLDKVS